jgi:hypothetical protein
MQTWDSPVYEQLFVTVRSVNQTLPPSKRLRVLAGDPPIEWDKIKNSEDHRRFLGERDTHFAQVVLEQVLKNGRKALLIIGDGHIPRHRGDAALIGPGPNVTELIEQEHPGSMFLIKPLTGFDDPTGKFERRTSSWPEPSIISLKGTWLGSLDTSALPGKFFAKQPDGTVKPVSLYKGMKCEDLFDAFLYLGRRDKLTLSPAPPEVFQDDNYWAELDRRSRLIFGRPFPEFLKRYNPGTRYYDPKRDQLPPPPPLPKP